MDVKRVQSGRVPRRPLIRVKRAGLVSAAALVAINIWTGSPLLALWIGSRVQGGSGLKMGAVVAVVVVLAALVLALAWALDWLSARYDELTGRPAAARQTSPWLRSMRDERGTDVRRKYGVSAVERVVIVTVVGAVLTFEVWFFFFAGSSLPSP
jgi:hypothetical protein